MKIGFVFPPMWNRLPEHSLGIWNYEVTRRLVEYCDILIYSRPFALQEEIQCKRRMDPMWNGLSEHSLGIWNHEVTSRLAGYCDMLMYSRPLALQEKVQCNRRIDHRGIITDFDRSVEKYLSIFFRGNKPFYTSTVFFFGYAFKVARDLRRQKCDIVHLYNYPQFIPIIKTLNPQIRIVLNIHGELLSQFDFGEIKRYLKKADIIISCSEFLSEKVRSQFSGFAPRCETVFMGVDPDRFSPGKSLDCAGSSEVKRLLYVGRLSPEKGVHVLLDAFSKVVDRYPGALLDIVGSEGIMPVEYLLSCSVAPSHVAELKQFYSTGYTIPGLRGRLPQNLTNRVTFKGLISHADLPDYYNNSDVYINPSYYESFGMSNIEAMACGTPVVSTPVGAVPEVIEHEKTGILIEPGDPSALADGIIRILDDVRLRRSIIKAAYEKAVSRFSWQSACEKLHALYNSIM